MDINNVYCMDCLEGMKQLDDDSVDLIVTDPPYLISYKTSHRKDKTHEFCTEIKNDNNHKLISKYINECYRIMKMNTAIYMFCSCDNVDFFKHELAIYFKIKNMIIWVKNNWTAGDLKHGFGKQYEILFLANKGKKEFNGLRISDIWNFDRIVGEKQVHQNQKPIKLIRQCIEKHSNNGCLVFDGFMGSGTTAIASKQLGRNFIGFELEQRYIDICNRSLRDTRYIGCIEYNTKSLNGFGG